MKVLVTGSAGRVGRAIYVHLSRFVDVTGLDRTPCSTADWVGELDSPGLLEKAMQGCDAVVHTAALHAPQVGRVEEAEFVRINVDGTARVIDAAMAARMQRIVFTSSTAVYGDAATPPGRAGWIDEDLSPTPATIYHRTKLAAEALLQTAAEGGGPQVCILRMSRCFPESANRMASFRLHRGIDARDVAAAHRLALRMSGELCTRYVISAPTPFTIDDLEQLYADAPAVLRRRAPALVEAFAARGWPLPGRIDRVYCSARAQAELGWKPRFGFDEVLRLWDAESSEVLRPGGDEDAAAD